MGLYLFNFCLINIQISLSLQRKDAKDNDKMQKQRKETKIKKH
jgi:hypothetical protein